MKDARAENENFRVVLDTNVYYSALHGREGVLARLFELGIQKRKYTIVVSPFIIAELASLLRENFLWEEEKIVRVVKRIVHGSDLVNPRTVPDAIREDPTDNNIVACALEGKADFIVSGDKHLLRLKEYEGIAILRPIEFLRTLGE